MSELLKAGNTARVLTSLHGGLKSIDARLENTEDALEGQCLIKEKTQVVFNKLKSELIELSSNVATVTTLIEELIRSQREILNLENREATDD